MIHDITPILIMLMDYLLNSSLEHDTTSTRVAVILRSYIGERISLHQQINNSALTIG